ncbi:MAG: polymerase [Spirochaetes bacterium]|nr:MAG: polymerase [Spirochaetota bacterium]
MATSLEKLKEALSNLTIEVENEYSKKKGIEVEAYSIEDGLKEASEILNIPISDLDYEIIVPGKKTLFSKKPYRLFIRVTESASLVGEKESEAGTPEGVAALMNDVDGKFSVRITRVGVVLKVTRPRGKGKKVKVEDILRALREKHITDFDKSKVAKVVREAKGEYVKIADFKPEERHNGSVVVEVSDDKMRAYVTLIPPKPGGRDLDIDDVMEALNEKGVVFGIKEDVIRESLEDEVYNVPILVAEGKRPKNGEDAKIVYNFRIDKKIQLEEDEKGQVNFKDLDLIENVVAGQLLATKIPATEGEPGKTITGEILEAKPGKDVELQPGKNTELSPDGMSIISTINGQVVLARGKINVEPVYEVNGDVDMRTGNILFLGTVIVKGNVEDGFSVKAAGDIEVRGSVGKCVLDAEGDINIKQGVMGKLGGIIKSGGSVWSKFLEQVTVVADKNVFVQDGIMHCNVDASEKVVCFGKRATIVGGRIRAGELVNTKTLGSVSFTETIVEVGVDPKSRQRLYDLENEKKEAEEQLHRLNANIRTLQNQKKTQRDFPPEKEELLEKMLSDREELNIRISEINEEMEELRSYLKLLKTVGKVSVSKNVYPGVRIGIKDIYYDVSNEFKAVTFVLESGRIRVKKYEEIDLEEIVGKRIQ